MIDLQADFFAQLAAQTLFGLFPSAQKAARYSPGTIGAKDVLQQQNAALVVKDEGTRRNSETPLTGTHRAAP